MNLNYKHQRNYTDFVLETLDLKSNNYSLANSEIPITQIIFDFCRIPKGSEAKYEEKWDSVEKSKSKAPRLQKFSVNEADYYLG